MRRHNQNFNLAILRPPKNLFLQVLKLGHCLLISTLPQDAHSKCYPVKRLFYFQHFHDLKKKLETPIRQTPPQTGFSHNFKLVKLNFESKLVMRQSISFAWVDFCMSKTMQKTAKTFDLNFIVSLWMRQVISLTILIKKSSKFLFLCQKFYKIL